MLRTLIALPVLIVLVLFALSNPQPVTLALLADRLQASMTPLSVAILVGAAGAFLLGALFVWIPALGARAPRPPVRAQPPAGWKPRSADLKKKPRSRDRRGGEVTWLA